MTPKLIFSPSVLSSRLIIPIAYSITLPRGGLIAILTLICISCKAIISCLNDSLCADTCPACFELLPSYGPLLRPIPTCVFKQQASSWLPHFTTFLLSPLTQLHWLPNEHASHVPQVPAPMTLNKGTSPQVLAPLSPCLLWPNFGGFCMALKECHASLSRTCEYDKSFNFICLSEDNLCGCDPSRFTPPFTAQCGKPNSWILHLFSPLALLPIFENGTTSYLFTETKSWTIIIDLFLHLSINPIYQYQSTYLYMYPNSIHFSSSLPLLS